MKRQKRYVVMLTETEYRVAKYACNYVREFSDMDGDHTAADGLRAERAATALDRASARDVQGDRIALLTAIDVMLDQCSCVPVGPYDEHKARDRDGSHGAGCSVYLWRHYIARLHSLVSVLRPATPHVTDNPRNPA